MEKLLLPPEVQKRIQAGVKMYVLDREGTGDRSLLVADARGNLLGTLYTDVEDGVKTRVEADAHIAFFNELTGSTVTWEENFAKRIEKDKKKT